jgi:phosphatidylglycerol:prolipoprotein diacylglycerol transferase
MNTFINFWQHMPEHIKPYIIQIGDFQVRYYGLMYILAFSVLYILSFHRLKTEDYDYPKTAVENYFVWAILGLMIGARLGYVIFYNLNYYMSHPLEIFLPFSFRGGFRFTGLAGMSYHGGLLGVIMSSAFFCHKYKIEFWKFGDFLVPSIPLGYTFGRIGNFINGELYGRATTVPWGMYFPLDTSGRLRHPSQLYEAFFEGIFLFIIFWSIRRKKVFDGFFFSLYVIGYGTVRFFIEFVREPDPQVGPLFGTITLGQILCLCMIFTGLGIYFIRRNRQQKT